jgi:hypothetical protein
MSFAIHESQINTWWYGAVYAENPESTLRDMYSDDWSGVRDAAMSPMYSFTIDGVTGERLDIHFMCTPRTVSAEEGLSRIDIRTPLSESGWFDMDINEQLAFAGISDEALEAYMQTATRFAEAQFNTSAVQDVRLDRLVANGMVNNAVELAALTFTAANHTGREAFIFIPSTNAALGMAFITTTHNDFIPGFTTDDDIAAVLEINRQNAATVGIFTAEGDSAATLTLRDNNEFTLRGPDYVSFIMSGSYRTENGRIILSAEGDETIFLMNAGSLIFESGAWLENFAESGTVFYPANDAPTQHRNP